MGSGNDGEDFAPGSVGDKCYDCSMSNCECEDGADEGEINEEKHKVGESCDEG